MDFDASKGHTVSEVNGIMSRGHKQRTGHDREGFNVPREGGGTYFHAKCCAEARVVIPKLKGYSYV